ncbi:MAG: hypothetical protein HY434_00645 [Candidatus Liptonbacteria bacterium]|nr:hypothetical protein [Candidatus Liptonbacteria bacterium]
MTTKILDQKTRELKREVELLRSFVIGRAGQDPEGEYNPAFVRKVLKAAEEKPKYEFKDAPSFLKHVRGK